MKPLLFALCMVVGLGTLATAEDKKPEKRDLDKIFAKLDENKDKKLSFDEFKGKRTGEQLEKAEKAFNRKDENKDKFLSLEEFKKMPMKKTK